MNEPWSFPGNRRSKLCGAIPKSNLSQTEAQRRIKQFGPNQSVKERRTNFWGVFKEEITKLVCLQARSLS